jgi:LysR family transcriptional activator of glutamate synthase operon
MDILKIRCFIALLHCGSFSAAAEELHISQSSLSKHIMSLEQEFNIVLFERRGRSTIPTAAGKEFTGHAARILDEYEKMVQKAAKFRNPPGKSIILGMAPMGCQFFWIQKVNEIMKRFPKYRLDFLEHEEVDLIVLAARKELDYMIIRKEILPARGFRTHVLLVDRAVAILPESHPLTRKPQITLSDLKDENLIFMDESTAPYKIFKDACIKAGFAPRISRTAKTETVTLSCIGAGKGISLYFESDTSFFRNVGNIRLRPLADGITSEIVLAAHALRKEGAIERALCSIRAESASDVLEDCVSAEA